MITKLKAVLQEEWLSFPDCSSPYDNNHCRFNQDSSWFKEQIKQPLDWPLSALCVIIFVSFTHPMAWYMYYNDACLSYSDKMFPP